MNNEISDNLVKTFSNITPIEIPLVTSRLITLEWFTGFTRGEGCFMFNVSKNAYKTGFKTALIFKDKILL